MQPWDTSLISNFFAEPQPHVVRRGRRTAVLHPARLGFIAPLVNLDHVDVQEESFGILFDDRARKISWVDTSNMMYIGGMFLGVADPFDMTDEELAEVRDFLVSKKHLVSFMWNQSYAFWQAFKRRRSGSGTRGRHRGLCGCRGMNYLYMEPKEGGFLGLRMGLFSETANYHHAHEYVTRGRARMPRSSSSATTTTGTRTRRPTSPWSPRDRQALGLDDPTVLDPPRRSPSRTSPAETCTSSSGARCRQPDGPRRLREDAVATLQATTSASAKEIRRRNVAERRDCSRRRSPSG